MSDKWLWWVIVILIVGALVVLAWCMAVNWGGGVGWETRSGMG